MSPRRSARLAAIPTPNYSLTKSRQKDGVQGNKGKISKLVDQIGSAVRSLKGKKTKPQGIAAALPRPPADLFSDSTLNGNDEEQMDVHDESVRVQKKKVRFLKVFFDL